ncbi:MAG: hypothetical protein HN782_01560 [Candidatus Marinimicrobia bacterium]|jgi:hypothetical protein|nr:hypothetical protein [Candidatus Neomarinimicrobiota bacterium]
MFENIFDFGFNRTNKQAFGFWLAWSLVAVLGGMFITFLLPSSGGTFDEGFEEGYVMGAIVAVFYCPLIAFLVLGAKNRLNELRYIVICLLSIIISLFLGGFFGLIPAAYLTTLEKN